MLSHHERNQLPTSDHNLLLTDANVLVAYIDQDDQHHQQTIAAWHYLREETDRLTTWPCLTEALQLTQRTQNRKERRLYLQSQIADLFHKGIAAIHSPGPEEFPRILELLEQFQDRPISLADASLVVVAETLNLTRVFTYDSDFRFYTMRNGETLEMYPQDFLVK